MAELLLGVDIGTSATKGVLARPDGTVVATTERAHDTSYPRPGWVEHDAEDVWWRDFTEVTKDLLGKADGPVAAVCVSGIGGTTLLADANGDPVRKAAILYGVDTRAPDEIDDLNQRIGRDQILQRCYNALTHQSIGPKLLWLQNNEPDTWARTQQLLMVNAFIVERLTGEYVLDTISASMCVPLFDLQGKRWIDEWAEEVAPGLALPRLVEPIEVAGEVSQRAADATGLPAGIPVAAGTIDSFAESASVGVRKPGDGMLIYGSTFSPAGVLAEPAPSEGLFSTPGVYPDTWMLMGATSTSGALTSWLRDIADGLPFEQLIDEAAGVRPGSEGLVVLPYFAGERTPHHDPDARGVIAGLTLRHGRGHLYRAVLEAAAYSVRQMLDELRRADVALERLVAVGGGTRGGLWTQIVSDVTGVRQELSEESVGAAHGDALMAGIACGLTKQDADWSRVANTVEPDPANREVYEHLYAIFERLYPATLDEVHALAQFQLSQELEN